MAQIYREQVQTQVTPTAPDTQIMQYEDKKRQAGLDTLGKLADRTMEIERKRIAQEEESLKDLTKKKALQAIQNAYTEFGNDPNTYEKVAQKSLKTIFDAVPDSPVKTNVMADVSIDKTGYDAKVRRQYRDKQEKIYLERYKDSVLSEVDAATSTLSNGFFTEDDVNTYTPEELLQRGNAYKDAEGKLARAYQSIYATDSNGNFVYSASERAMIKDRFENRGFYGAVDYVQDNVQNNYESAIKLRNRFENNKELVMKQYGIESDEMYNKTLSAMDKVISGQRTGDTEKQIHSTQTLLNARVKDLDLKANPDGSFKVGNKKMNNLNETIGLLTAYDQAEASGMYPDEVDKKKLYNEKAKLNKVVIDQIESNIPVKNKFWDFGALNTGETALIQSNNNLNELIENSGITDEQQILDIKSQFYRQTLGELQKAGVSLEGNTDQDLAKKVANKAYYDYAKKIVGDINIGENDDPRTKINEALLDRKNKVAMSNIQSRVDARIRSILEVK